LFCYALATIGLFFVAVGVALSIISNLGTSPLSAPAYVLSGQMGLTVGNWTIVVNMTFMLIQMAVLGKKFKAKYLLQIIATVIFGYLIDFSIWAFDWVSATTLFSRILLIVLACFVTALGVSIEVISKGWMLSAELAQYAISETFKLPFENVKIAFDSSMLVVALVLAVILYHNPFGFGEYQGVVKALFGQSEGIVIGTGTIMMAVLAGLFMKITDPLVDRMFDKLFGWIVYRKN